MAFLKAIQHTNSGPLHEFKIATREYREACKKFTQIRILASHPAATLEQIARLHYAKPEYRESCRQYNNARLKYIASVQVLADAASPNTVISNKELYNTEIKANDWAIGQELRKEAALKELGGQEAVDAIMAEVAERRKAREEGFDLEKYENATKPLMGDKPFKLDDDGTPFGELL
jgi:hypothetical protein